MFRSVGLRLYTVIIIILAELLQYSTEGLLQYIKAERSYYSTVRSGATAVHYSGATAVAVLQ